MSDSLALTRAQGIRQQEEVPYTAPSGREYLLLRPKPRHLSAAGIPIACFSHTTPLQDRLQMHQKALEEIQAEEERALEFSGKLFAQCLLAPKWFNGPASQCPEDSVCIDHIEADVGPMFMKLLELAGYFTAEDVGRKAEAFREDAGGEAAEPGGEVLPGATESPAGGRPDRTCR